MATVTKRKGKHVSVERVSGGMTWVVTSNGERHVYKVRPKSVARIKEASSRYGDALKRLADR